MREGDVTAKLSILALVITLAVATVSSATTVVVDWSGGGDYLLIQSGIDFASEGDTVLVMPGIYEGPGNTYLGFGGTNLVLRSSGGARSTVIDAEGLDHCFYFSGSESAASVIEGFTITNGSAADGAGMYLVNSSPTIRDCVFNGNIATTHAGGIYCTSGANPTLTGCTFSNNQADYGAAAGFALSVTPTFESCTFSDNVALWAGGGVWIYSSSPSFTGCSFEGNSVPSDYYDGGGVYCRTFSSPTFTDCSFSNNTAPEHGGAVLIREYSSPSFVTCTFAGNTANFGAGVTVYNDMASSFDNCRFYDNTATYDGGAVHSTFSAVATFTDCTMLENTAGDEGGAMYLHNHSTPVLTGCTLYANSAPEGSGIWCDADFTLTNSIIAFGVSGEAVYCDGDPPCVTCSDICSNAGGDWVDCLAGMDATDNNIHADPLFCDAPGGDFTIDVASPCTAANAPACGLIGAHDIGCDTPVQPQSWGAIKSMYR
jgi:parallel beta-helix repeat protein/predicted outer membrane repeat protein